MTTLILDWSDFDGAVAGVVTLSTEQWRRDPDTHRVPWTHREWVDGRAVVDVSGAAGEVLRVLWSPAGGVEPRTDVVLVPAEGEHLAHLLDRVDPSTLEPLPEAMPSAADLISRAEALTARIESGEFTGEAGVGVESITDDDGDGVATVTLSDGSTSSLPLPRGLEGAPGRDGVDGAPGADGRDGQDGRTPDLTWQGTALAVDGVPGPDLRGPAGEDGADGVNGEDGAPGPAPSIKIGTVTSGATPSATITGTSPDLTLGLVLPKGDPGQPGTQGPPGVVSSASAYVIVGPGRPDQPSTTAGVITGSEPVGAEYRSTDGASVGAWAWRKRGTGWAVTDGDTGWRDVTALQTSTPTLTSGRFLLRRVGVDVYASFEDMRWATGGGGNTAQLTFPSGFVAKAKYMGALYGYFSTAWGYSFRTDWPRIWPTSSGDIWLRDYREWATADTWPTTLPGSPA